MKANAVSNRFNESRMHAQHGVITMVMDEVRHTAWRDMRWHVWDVVAVQVWTDAWDHVYEELSWT